jgi:hypothetical protein
MAVYNQMNLILIKRKIELDDLEIDADRDMLNQCRI